MTEGATPEISGSWSGRISFLAAFLVILMAIGAVIWPRSDRQSGSAVLLVFDPSGEVARQEAFYRPLADFLSEIGGPRLELAVARKVGDFFALSSEGAEFLLCPAGLVLDLLPAEFTPLVVARRPIPHNLRPRSVLVYRKAGGPAAAPWREHPGRTVFGDSVSLTATAALRLEGGDAGLPAKPPGCVWGPDPYDHAAVLHAARLGAFDYAVVRQWDAERFFQGGLLTRQDWGMEFLSDPVPDLVLLCRAHRPPAERLRFRQALASLGRSQQPAEPPSERLLVGLDRMHLAGFNFLLEPELTIVRDHFPGDWPPARK